MALNNNKQQLINHLLNTNNFTTTIEYSLTVIKKLNFSINYPIILVGGTNGKGSTCAYLSTILKEAGYKVGTFTSPHVFEYNERIAINNKPIDDQTLVEALNFVINIDERNLGIFKTFTLAAHHIFIKANIDIAIIEVGIGGISDITNLFEPQISAITTVGLDHCQILGNTIEEISAQKAGIYRKNKYAFFGDTSISDVVIDYAKNIGAKLQRLGHDYSFKRNQLSWDFHSKDGNYYSLPLPHLIGDKQLNNAALAIAILIKLKSQFPIGLNQIKQGIVHTNLIGRCQLLAGLPQILIDSAHNPQAVNLLIENMLKLPFSKHNFAVFGIANDKDWQTILDNCHKYFNKWFIAPITSSRSANPVAIANYLLSIGVDHQAIIQCSSIAQASELCYQQLEQNDRGVFFGSFLVAEQAFLKIQQLRQ